LHCRRCLQYKFAKKFHLKTITHAENQAGVGFLHAGWRHVVIIHIHLRGHIHIFNNRNTQTYFGFEQSVSSVLKAYRQIIVVEKHQAFVPEFSLIVQSQA